jgi:hypothetical protein
MIDIKFQGTVETADLVSVTVDVKTGSVSTVYRITEGTEQTYRTIPVPGINATAFVALVVAGAKTEIGKSVTKTIAEDPVVLP